MDTREKIIDAADKCLLEKGSRATCIKAIAETAGVNHGLIHHYFGSKEKLFIELAKRYFEGISPAPTLSLQSEDDILNYFKKSVIPSARIMLEFRTMSVHMPELRKELVLMAQKLRNSLKDILNISEEQALILTGSILGLGFNALLEPSIDIDKQIHIIVKLLFNPEFPEF